MDPNLPSPSNPQAGQPQAYAGQPPPYASAPPPYAPQYTGQIPQYSGQAPQCPGQAPQYPSQAPQYPGQAPQYPGQNPYIQGQAPHYPVQAPQYPGQAPQYAAQGPQYPAQTQYPGQVPQHPGQAPMQVPLVVQTQAVYGLNIANIELAALTRRVLNLSVAVMVVYCIGAAVQITTLESIGFQFSTIDDNDDFDFGEISGGVLVALVLRLAINLIVPCCGYFGAKKNNQDMLCCFCGCNGFMAVLQVLSLISYASSFSTISIPLSIVTLILQCSSFHYGRNLHDKLRNGAVIHMAPAPVYSQTAVQPV